MSDATINETDILSRMDDSKVTKQHWEVVFISGMGFTDAMTFSSSALSYRV
jgi:hypothetical protein